MSSAKPYHQPNGNFSHDFIYSKHEMILLFLLDGMISLWMSVVGHHVIRDAPVDRIDCLLTVDRLLLT
jgi:hypothetical protein